MNDEIKEILEMLRKYGSTNDKVLLDYITNLQQENERLKETNVYCNRTDCVGRIKDSRKYDSVYQEKEDYKSRCEKINEILKESPDFNYSNDYIILKRRIEDIIKNGSENNGN